MIANNFTEKLFFSTVRIELLDRQTMGTGFICEARAKNGLNYQFLVTNKHLVSSHKDNIKLLFNVKDPHNNMAKFGETYSVETSKIDKDAFQLHDNEDLACINISEVFVKRNDLFWASIMMDFIANYETDGVLAGNDVFFVGYPANRYDRINNLPVLRSGKIASLPQINFENESKILIDAQVFGGSSGSPVFSVCKGQYKFIGVVCSTMIKNQQIEMPDKNSFASFDQTIGIGLVIKSDRVKELLDKAIQISDSYQKD